MFSFPRRPLFWSLILSALFSLAGCSDVNLRFKGFEDDREHYQATIIYRTLQGDRRTARVGLGSVTDDKKIDNTQTVAVQKSTAKQPLLTYRADGIYMETRTSQPTRLVKGRNLTDPVFVKTPDPDLLILAYIGLKGRQPVLKMRLVRNGTVADKSLAIPLNGSVDSYILSDFTYKESP